MRDIVSAQFFRLFPELTLSSEIEDLLERLIEIMPMMNDQIENFINERNETEPELFGDRFDRESGVGFAIGDRGADIDFATDRPVLIWLRFNKVFSKIELPAPDCRSMILIFRLVRSPIVRIANGFPVATKRPCRRRAHSIKTTGCSRPEPVVEPFRCGIRFGFRCFDRANGQSESAGTAICP